MKILICEFGLILFFFFFGFIYIQNVIILNFMWTWKNYEYLSWCMKRPTIFMRLSSTKEFGGLSLLHHLFFNLMHLLVKENKSIHFILGSAHLPLDHSALNRFEYHSPWLTLWCGFYRWGRSCAQEIKKVCQTDRKRTCSF